MPTPLLYLCFLPVDIAYNLLELLIVVGTGYLSKSTAEIICFVQRFYYISSFIFIEFENAETLLISEVHLLLDHRKQQNQSAEEEQELSEVFLKTLTYTERFRKFKNKETIAAVRRYVTTLPLTLILKTLEFCCLGGFVPRNYTLFVILKLNNERLLNFCESNNHFHLNFSKEATQNSKILELVFRIDSLMSLCYHQGTLGMFSYWNIDLEIVCEKKEA